MGLGTENYSPAVLQKVEYAGAHAPSFAQASAAMEQLAELTISPKHTQRLTERLGRERAQARDRDVQAMQARTLHPAYPQAPRVVAVQVDAGKVQLREAPSPAGVHGPHWGDVKVACLQSYAFRPRASDPQPHPPKAFLDPPKVMKLVAEMERVRGTPSKTAAGPLLKGRASPQTPPGATDRPKRLVRTVVATTAKAEAFGWMVGAEAMRRGFYDAPVKAVVGDGGNWIGPLAQMHFPGWLEVLDFLHLLVHLWAGAMAAHRDDPPAAWALYERLLRRAWAGATREVIAALEQEARRLGPPPKKAPDEDPRRTLARVVGYLKANAPRMDYPRYRRLGLPVTSALVESLIKQINLRLKGSEKFWVDGGAEATLQVRAAYLSQDGRDVSFHRHRPRGPAAHRGKLRVAA